MSVQCSVCEKYFDSPNLLMEHKAIYHKQSGEIYGISKVGDVGTVTVKDIPRINVQMKKCPHCQVNKPLDDFYHNKTRKDGLSVFCKDCQNKCQRKHRESKLKNNGHKEEHQTEPKVVEAASPKLLSKTLYCSNCQTAWVSPRPMAYCPDCGPKMVQVCKIKRLSVEEIQ